MSDEQHNADAATESAIEAHLTGNPEKAAPLFNRARVEHERAAATESTGTEPTWRDGHTALAPMPDAPQVATGEVDVAIARLTERGPEHAQLVQNWGPDFGQNLAYAKNAFRAIAANRPDLIAKVEASGLGDDPAVLELLAKHGRLSAGLMGDFTVARNSESTFQTPERGSRASPTRGGSAQAELNQLLNDNPPGSQSYKNPRVQQRVEALSRMIAGGGSVVGQGGRYA
jgi:hypothetical protein